jgi:hypothetical protein
MSTQKNCSMCTSAKISRTLIGFAPRYAQSSFCRLGGIILLQRASTSCTAVSSSSSVVSSPCKRTNLCTTCAMHLIKLVLAHRKYYPKIAFFPWFYGAHCLEHLFELARSFLPNFTCVEFLLLLCHIYLCQVSLLSLAKSGVTKCDWDLKTAGYIYDGTFKVLTEGELKDLTIWPSDSLIEDTAKVAMVEVTGLIVQVCTSITDCSCNAHFFSRCSASPSQNCHSNSLADLLCHRQSCLRQQKRELRRMIWLRRTQRSKVWPMTQLRRMKAMRSGASTRTTS